MPVSSLSELSGRRFPSAAPIDIRPQHCAAILLLPFRRQSRAFCLRRFRRNASGGQPFSSGANWKETS
jgi:hypothetical protein